MGDLSWWQILADLPDMVRSDIENGADLSDEDSRDEYCHEFTDGSEHVIYYSNVMRLWCAEQTIRDWEDEARDIAVSDGVLDVMTACVYLALRDAVANAVSDVVDELRADSIS